jgi:hypothetical protein
MGWKIPGKREGKKEKRVYGRNRVWKNPGVLNFMAEFVRKHTRKSKKGLVIWETWRHSFKFPPRRYSPRRANICDRGELYGRNKVNSQTPAMQDPVATDERSCLKPATLALLESGLTPTPDISLPPPFSSVHSPLQTGPPTCARREMVDPPSRRISSTLSGLQCQPTGKIREREVYRRYFLSCLR